MRILPQLVFTPAVDGPKLALFMGLSKRVSRIVFLR